jgi:hypothetical protein
VAQVGFDGLGGDEQGLGDLAILQPAGGHCGHAALAWGERFAPDPDNSAGAGAGGGELDPGSLAQRCGATRLGEPESAPERLACVGAMTGATQR